LPRAAGNCRGDARIKSVERCEAQTCGDHTQVSAEAGREQVLRQLARIIDPDFGQDIVSCGFVKQLEVAPEAGSVRFALELTTPACPIKDEFERKARDYVADLDWVREVGVFTS
jgi:metal-sulfur cluster biosynthetic enzyme